MPTLKGIAKLTTLKVLRAQQCEDVTRAGISNLAPLKELEELSFSHTKIDDAAVETLCAMKKLKTLSVDSTKITDAGFARLTAALPECKIYFK